MNKIEIKLSDVEIAALNHVMEDPQEWLQNAIRERARLAYEEIVALETQRMMQDPNIKTMPANSDEIVLNANKQNIERGMA